MKIPSSTLKSIALSAGITASIGTATAASSPERQAKPGKAEPQPIPAAVEEPKIAICEKAPIIRRMPPAVIKSSKQIFTEADANKDGKLDNTEFDKAFQLIVAQEKAKAAMKKPDLVVPHPIQGDDCPGCGLG